MDATACPATAAASPATALVETCAAGNVVEQDVILNVERGLRVWKLRTTWRQSMRIGSFAN